MIEQESGQEFALDLLDEILDCTVQVIHDKYIQSQLHPYSVNAAKDLLLQIIEVKHSSCSCNKSNPFINTYCFFPVPVFSTPWHCFSYPNCFSFTYFPSTIIFVFLTISLLPPHFLLIHACAFPIPSISFPSNTNSSSIHCCTPL